MQSNYGKKVDSKLIAPTKASEISTISHWASLKWFIMAKSATATIFLIGLAATLTRYLKKLVHRFCSDSPKFYNLSFWLQLVAVFYFTYVFLSYFHLGLIANHWFLKLDMIMINTLVVAMIKIIMIEASQNRLIRDLAIINVLFMSYVYTYSFAGFPWIAFLTYAAVIFDQILCKHLIDMSSDLLLNSV